MHIKLKDDKFIYTYPDEMKNIILCNYAGNLPGALTIQGFFVVVDNFFLDTGNPNSSIGKFSEFLGKLDHSRRWVVLNTHLHEDHCGKNYMVRGELGAEIYAPEHVTDFSFVSRLLDYFWGRPVPFEHKFFDRDVYTTDSGRKIEIIPTPGHSAGHVAFRILPDDIIYSGDAIPLPAVKRYITSGENYILQIESLKKLRACAERGSRIISAHHGIISRPVRLIDDRIRGMSAVVEGVRMHLDSGITDIDDIGRGVFGPPELLYTLFGNSIRCRQDWAIESIISGLGFNKPDTGIV